MRCNVVPPSELHDCNATGVCAPFRGNLFFSGFPGFLVFFVVVLLLMGNLRLQKSMQPKVPHYYTFNLKYSQIQSKSEKKKRKEKQERHMGVALAGDAMPRGGRGWAPGCFPVGSRDAAFEYDISITWRGPQVLQRRHPRVFGTGTVCNATVFGHNTLSTGQASYLK